MRRLEMPVMDGNKLVYGMIHHEFNIFLYSQLSIFHAMDT